MKKNIGTELVNEVELHFSFLANTLSSISDSSYKEPLSILGNASIGGHTRHIIELFQEMIKGYALGYINYENRERNQQIQTEPQVALRTLNEITLHLPLEEKPLILQTSFSSSDGAFMQIQSTYYRELVYNIEHTIHHMALIRAGLTSLGVEVDTDFGVAPSTIKYRKLCAP
jgi:uncharacterized damage-inducible protein DinB